MNMLKDKLRSLFVWENSKYQYPVPVVRLIVSDAQRRFLLLRRTAHTAHRLWTLPGGKIDYGESVEEACRSELYEETGLTCTRVEFLFYQDSPPHN